MAQLETPAPPSGNGPSLASVLLKAFGLGVLAAALVFAGYFLFVDRKGAGQGEPSPGTDRAGQDIEVIPLSAEDGTAKLTGVPTAAPTPQRPIVPAEGFTPANLAVLDDQALLVLLRWPEAEPPALSLALAEVSKREKPVFLPAIVELLSHSSDVARASALKAAMKPAYLRDDQVVQGAYNCLGDVSAIVRGWAVRVLAETGSRTAREKLENLEKQEQSEIVKKVLKQSLARFPK